jgi:histone-lysine N-methyltransferase SETMAR
MDIQNEHFRHCMLYEFRQGKNAAQATRAICSVYGDGILDERCCQRWFKRFREGDFCLEDKPRCGRPLEIDRDELEVLLEEDPRLSSVELAKQLSVSHTTVLRQLHELGKVYKVGKWVPHSLTERNLNQRLTTCISHLARYKKKDFLWKIVTGDEKWIYYTNSHNKKQWSSPGQTTLATPRTNRLEKKVMLCVWWDMKGILYYELLEPGQTVNAQHYSQQLRRLNEKILEKRSGPGHGNRKVILLHDNARPHVAISTQNIILELGWEVMPHSAYSPDLAPSDYHLFRSLEHTLRGMSFETRKDIQNCLDFYFASKPVSFYRDGIRDLPMRWQSVIDNNGNYFNYD